MHGLYGMSDNWLSIARLLADSYTVWIPDLRNHGRSPHYESHTYEELASDIFSFIHEHRIENPIVLGHSMGGKAAMKLAMFYPEVCSQLIVADIAPVNYSAYQQHETRFHQHIIHSLLSLPIETIQTREEAEKWLSAHLSNATLRAFLLKNLQRNEHKKFYWMLNLPVLQSFLPHIIDGFDHWESYRFPDINITFLRGEHSGYISEENIQAIKKIYPKANITTIPSSSHWLHADNPQVFVSEVKKLIQ